MLDVYHFLCSVISSRRFCSYDWPQFHYYYKRQITFVRRISWKKIHAIFNDSIIIALAIRSDLLLGQNHLLIDFIKKIIFPKKHFDWVIAKLVLILANQIAQISLNFTLQLTFSQQYTFVLFCLHDPAYTLFDASSPCDFNAVSIQFGRGRSVFNFIDAQSYNISIFLCSMSFLFYLLIE